jgi:hypothetical protein
VTRGGRTMIFNVVGVGDFDKAIVALDAQIDALEASCTGKRRRRALSVSF